MVGKVVVFHFQHTVVLVPSQSLKPVLVIRREPASGSAPAGGVAITRTHSAIERVTPDVLVGQTSADSRYAAFAKVSPENVLNGTVDAVTPPHAVDGEGAVAVAVPLAAVVNPK